MQTPERLFGPACSPSDLLSHSPFLERADLELEREREDAARVALGAYAVARLVEQTLHSASDPDAARGIRRQLEATRRRVRDLPAGEPEATHLLDVVNAVAAAGAPSPAVRASLTAYAAYLEREGRLSEGLDVLGLAARAGGAGLPPGELVGYALFAGRLNRLLARWDAAQACYEAAEAMARGAGDAVSALRAHLGISGVLRGRGNLPAARAAALAVAGEARELGLTEVQSMAFSDLGAVDAVEGRRLEAVWANYQALRFTADPDRRVRVLGDLGVCLADLGGYEGARTAFEIVIASAEAPFVIRTNALLELMDIESAAGDWEAFRWRRAEAARFRGRMPPSMLVDYCYKTGVGLARFGRPGRAAQLLAAGLRLAEQHRLNAWYFRLERALADLDRGRRRRETGAPDLSDAPAVQEVTIGLREYAASAGYGLLPDP